MSYDATHYPDCTWRPYAADSPFNTPIPKNPALDPRTGTADDPMLYTHFNIPQNNEGAPVGADDWAHPTYWGIAADPVYTITIKQWGKELNGSKVHMPKGAKPAGGGDGHLNVIDQATGMEYSFWQAKVDDAGRTIIANGGGRGQIDGDGVDDVGSATAACFGCSAGMIRAVEIAAGEINHAIFSVATFHDTPYWPPAKGPAKITASSLWPQGKRPHNGQRLWLNMLPAEIDAKPWKPWEKAIARCLAKYGSIEGDTGHYGTVGVDFMIESQQPYVTFLGTNPLRDWMKAQGISSINWGPALESVRDRFRWLAKP